FCIASEARISHSLLIAFFQFSLQIYSNQCIFSLNLFFSSSLSLSLSLSLSFNLQLSFSSSIRLLAVIVVIEEKLFHTHSNTSNHLVQFDKDIVRKREQQ
ncbi:hypothetical protein SSS_10707, partial [Sarcoptes scabiei]